MTEATAAALAPDTAMPEPVAEMSEEQELAAAYDAMNDDSAPAEKPEPIEEPEEPETAEETEAEAETPDEPETAEDAETEEEPETDEPVAEAPSDLPRGVRDSWKDLPESAREAITEAHREQARKLSEQGRQIQGIGPIRDTLVTAVKELPELAHMRPEQVAAEVFELAKTSAAFSSDPVNTLMGLVDKHGLREPLAQALGGQAPEKSAMQQNALMKHISQLEAKLQQVSDPNYIRQNVEEYTTQASLEAQVGEFAQTAEHWGTVEAQMPAAIQYVQSVNPDLPPKDILKGAYDLAVSQTMPRNQQAQPETVAQPATPTADPKQTEAAIKAKSVNVKSTPSKKTRTLTEEQELARVYDKMHE